MSIMGKGLSLGHPLPKVLKMVFKDLSFALFWIVGFYHSSGIDQRRR